MKPFSFKKIESETSAEGRYRCIAVVWLSLVCQFWFLSSNAMAGDSEINLKNFDVVKNQYSGKRALMILWSLDCPPCFKELETVARISKEQPNLSIMLLNADDSSETAIERGGVLKEYGLTELNNYYFKSDQISALKRRLDETWYGELPRSYFISKDGKWLGRSGVIEEKHIRLWFDI